MGTIHFITERASIIIIHILNAFTHCAGIPFLLILLVCNILFCSIIKPLSSSTCMLIYNPLTEYNQFIHAPFPSEPTHLQTISACLCSNMTLYHEEGGVELRPVSRMHPGMCQNITL